MKSSADQGPYTDQNSIRYVSNLFTDSELEEIQKSLDRVPEDASEEHGYLGRLNIGIIDLPPELEKKLTNYVNTFAFKKNLRMNNPMAVRYDPAYGRPNLPVHVDSDFNDFIFLYQFSSNTDWKVGANLHIFDLEDNSALIMNPNTNVHWRPIKIFNPGEYVTMIFFRFFSEHDKSDYSHIPNHPGHEMFKDYVAYRIEKSEAFGKDLLYQIRNNPNRIDV